MITNDTPIVLIMTAFLATAISFYYLNHHIHIMDPYPFKLGGAAVYAASALIGLSLSYLLKALWNERGNLATVFSPRPGRLALCAVIALLTPVVNLLWLPVPLGALLFLSLVHGNFEKGAVLSMLAFFVAAYGVACLTAIETHSFWRLVSPSVLYLVGVFAAVTMFAGITYI